MDLAPGVEVAEFAQGGASFRVVTVDLTRARLDLIGQADGDPREVDALLAAPPAGFVAATNAGMYHRPDDPVGLFVQDGVERSPIDLQTGQPGNFYLAPNAVFYVDAAGAHVVASTAYAPAGPVRLATQSGPALVLGGAIHPAFDPQSTSKTVRNAVCASSPSTVRLVLSVEPVRFMDLALLVRDQLGCADALYLDGHISGMWGPSLPKGPRRFPYAGFLVVTTPAGSEPCCTTSPP
ncbi:MAG: phosphodiester glycosidase family protein [Myxococcota bacterium]